MIDRRFRIGVNQYEPGEGSSGSTGFTDSTDSSSFDWNNVGKWVTDLAATLMNPNSSQSNQTLAIATAQAQLAAAAQANTIKFVLIGGVAVTAMFLYFAQRKKI